MSACLLEHSDKEKGTDLDDRRGCGVLGAPQHHARLALLLGSVLVHPNGSIGAVGGGHHAGSWTQQTEYIWQYMSAELR